MIIDSQSESIECFIFLNTTKINQWSRNNMSKTKRKSPFGKEFWLDKGYSVEEAEYKRNSIRPIKKEYWLERGYSEQDAIEKAEQTKRNNNKKGAQKVGEKPKDFFRQRSPRCKEYWLNKGYSEEESLQKLNEFQNHFSLEKCIEKYGQNEGYKRFLERQQKWQTTLNNKPLGEWQDIQKRKSTIRLRDHESIDECINRLYQSHNMKLFPSIEQFTNHLQDQMKEKPYIRYVPVNEYIQKYMSNVQIEIFERQGIDNWLEQISPYFSNEDYLMKSGNKQSYRMWVEGRGLLRSSYEIYFYEKFVEQYPEIDLEIDGKYPNSSFRFDFKIGNIYIEIAPNYDTDEKYRIKMNKKKELFDCIILKNIDDIDNFLDREISGL